jgi:hypothetical protein
VLEEIVANPEGEDALLFCTAHLCPENDNPVDDAAVSVNVDGRKVGYLGRDLARTLREHLTVNNIPVQVTTCDAVITNGLRTGEHEYSYTVELDLSIPSSLPGFGRPACPESVRRSTSPIFYWREPGWCIVETRIPFHARTDHGEKINCWTKDSWTELNVNLENSRGIGVGYKLFSLDKAFVIERFGCLPSARLKLIHGSIVMVELRVVSS